MGAPRSSAYVVGSNPISPKTNHQDCTEPDIVNGNRCDEAQGKEVSGRKAHSLKGLSPEILYSHRG